MNKLNYFIKTIFNFSCNLWLIGAMFKAGRKTYAEALYEFTYMLLWSVLPFALGALALYVTSDDANKSFINLGISTFRNGELLVFTISMLTPILYLTLYDPDKAGPFPHKLLISTVVAFIVVTSAALFALSKASAVKDAAFVFSLSVVLTVLALAIRYLALIYHRIRLQPMTESDFRSSQTSFLNESKLHFGEPAAQAPTSATDFTNSLQHHFREQQ